MYCSKPGLYMTDSVLSTTVLLLKVGSTVISIPYIREHQQREAEVEELGWDANMGSLPRICVLTPTDDYFPMIKEIIQRSDLKRQAQNDTDSKKTRRDSNSHLPDWTDPICHPGIGMCSSTLLFQAGASESSHLLGSCHTQICPTMNSQQKNPALLPPGPEHQAFYSIRSLTFPP